jgi:uncharacterized Zn-binding protein involved in type VI secretion
MGAPNVVMTATMQCSFGLAPSTVVALPKGPPVMIEGKLAATVADTIPMANIPPFAMCMSLSNPMVIAATTAALGVLTPMPCVPAPIGQWLPGALQTKINGMPALTAGSTLNCAYGGVIAVLMPGAMKTLSG